MPVREPHPVLVIIDPGADPGRVGWVQALDRRGCTMANKYNSARYRNAAIIFAVSLVASVATGMFGPRMLGLNVMPEWMFKTMLAIGFISVLTVPMAWRWLYRRDTD